MPRRGWSTVAVGGKTWKRALPGWFLVLGRSLCRYSLPQSERLLWGRSGHTRRSGHWRIKAIRMIGGTGIAGSAVKRLAQYGLPGIRAIHSSPKGLGLVQHLMSLV